MKVRKAVIIAAGWGTRFLPITRSQPKEMLPLVDKPLIQHSVEEAINSGIETDNYDEQDIADANAFYSVLEEQVVPLFYQRDQDNIPRGWVAMMR